MDSSVADHINTLAAFCGKRDLDTLSQESLFQKYGIHQADVMVLFGGSILCGGDLLAEAIQNKVAKTYVIVGGAGHTTDALRQIVHREYPQIITQNLSEAETFARYLQAAYGLRADYLETESTNCGNNITNLLDLLKKHAIAFTSIILCQDASMQHRMEAGLRKYIPEGIAIINFAAYRAKVVSRAGALSYETEIHGMWETDRYVHLLMGEIPRLRDDEEGYGPKGKDFIAHVDIPEQVEHAFSQLQQHFGHEIRQANPLYASK